MNYRPFTGAYNPFIGGNNMMGQGPYGTSRPMMPGGVPGMQSNPNPNPHGFGSYSTGPRGGAGGLRWNYGTGWTYAGAPQQQPNDPYIPLLGRTREQIQEHIAGLTKRIDPYETERPGYVNPAAPPRRVYTF